MILNAGIVESSNGYFFTRKKGIPFWVLSYLVQGENEKTVGKHTTKRRAPYIALSRPNITYSVTTTAQNSHYLEYWVTFEPKPEWTRLLIWPEEQAGSVYLHLDVPHEALALQHAFEDLIACSRNAHAEQQALAANALERILLMMQPLRPSSKCRITDERVQMAMEFINTNLKNRITLREIARQACLSPFRLAHIFKINVGMAPLHYLERQRIEAAKSLLLATNYTIYAIAEQVGFNNPYHFSTRFRRCVGISPRVFRDQTMRPNKA